MERELRRSRERLAEAERVAGIGSWEWDIANDRISWSDGLLNLYGITRDDFNPIVATGVEERVFPDDRGRVLELCTGRFRSGQPSRSSTGASAVTAGSARCATAARSSSMTSVSRSAWSASPRTSLTPSLLRKHFRAHRPTRAPCHRASRAGTSNRRRPRATTARPTHHPPARGPAPGRGRPHQRPDLTTTVRERGNRQVAHQADSDQDTLVESRRSRRPRAWRTEVARGCAVVHQPPGRSGSTTQHSARRS